MPLGKGVFLERGHKRGALPKKFLFYCYWLAANVKTVADRHTHAAYHNKH